MKIDKVYLAPMEGVADAPMRQVLTAHGGYDECFSEFIRVTDEVLPYKTLLRDVPELEHGAVTTSGVNVRVQFLGDNPKILLQSAKRAVELGARAIDMNFGCPSRFVHHGGAMLLKEPELLHEIVSTLREGLDSSVHLSVKMRAGFASKEEAPVLVKAVAVDGVNEIIIHARTRKDLYREDALDWSIIKNLHELADNIPIVANGDICCYDDAQNCATISDCDRLMVGRAALMLPNIGHVIKKADKIYSSARTLALVLELMTELKKRKTHDKAVMDRSKQFLGFARRNNVILSDFFKIFCRIGDLKNAMLCLESMITALENKGIEN